MAASVATVAMFGGCSDSSMSGPSGSATTSTRSSMADVAFNDADVHFTESMIPHHDQAVEMSKMVLAKRGVTSEVRTLAQQIQAAQEPQIGHMNQWLETWGHPSGAAHDEGAEESGPGHHGGEGGLMTEAQMKALDDATGQAGQKLYLEGMIRHHQGAVAMAEAEMKDGKYPDAIRLAAGLVKDQNAQIATMQNLLATL